MNKPAACRLSLIIFLLLPFILVQCSTESTVDLPTTPSAIETLSQDVYFHAYAHPLQLGRSWGYESEYYSTNFDPPELADSYYFSMNRYSTVWIGGAETLPSGAEAVKVNELWQHGDMTTESAIWLENTKSFVKLHGKDAGYALTQPLKMWDNNTFRFAGREFESLAHLRHYLGNGIVEFCRQDDTTWYDPPLNSIKTLPIMGARWGYLDQIDPYPLVIEKEYTDFSEVTVGAGTWYTWEVTWHHDSDADGEFDDDFTIYDRIADVGLISRRYEVLGVTVMGDFGETIGTFDMIEQWELQTYSVPGQAVYR